MSQIPGVYFTERWCLDSAIPWYVTRSSEAPGNVQVSTTHLPDYRADFLAVLSILNGTKCLCPGLWTVPRVPSPQFLSEARGSQSKSASQAAEQQAALYWHRVMNDRMYWGGCSRHYSQSQEHFWNGCLTIPSTTKGVHISKFIITTSDQITLITESVQRPTRSVKIQSNRWGYEHFDTRRSLL